MKNIMLMTATISTLATASMADNFDNNVYTATVETGAAEIQFGFADEALATFEGGITAVTYELGTAQSVVQAAFAYDFDTDEISILGSHTTTAYAANFSVYGTSELEYRTPETDLSDGDFYVNPSVGADYAFNNTVSVFGEVGYSWNASDDWAKQGGYVEVGMPIDTSYNIVFTPSVFRGFDDGLDETNLNIDMTLNF